MADQRQSGAQMKKGKGKANQRKKRKPAQPTFVGYVLEVTSSGFYYGVRLGDSRFNDKTYSEMAHIKIEGTLLAPREPKHPARMQLTLMSSKDMLEETGTAPLGVGGMAVREEYIDAFVWVPAERLTLIAHFLHTSNYVRFNMTGHRIRWRTARLFSFSMTDEPIDPDDL